MSLQRLVPLFLCCVSAAGHAAQVYAITDLGTLGGGQSAANAISNSGLVVGYADTGSGNQPFVWSSNHGMQQIQTGSTEGQALGVNSAGTVVGVYNDSDGLQHAFAWTAEAGLVDLTPPATTGAFASDVNEDGRIVGTAYFGSGIATGVIWIGGVAQPLPLPLGYQSYAYEINDAGQIAGAACTPGSGCSGATILPAFWADLSSLQIIPTGGSGSGINDDGIVTGAMPGTDGAWTWSQSGGVHLLATLGGINAGATGINSSGIAVGYAFPAGSGNSHAALWAPDGQIVDLNTVVLDLAGWQFLNAATAINDFGQIVGYGQIESGLTHAFVLTPVPVPAAGWLLGSAVCFLASLASRRMASVGLGKNVQR
jgi:probable HAF family extracellular repeat protein